MVDYKKSEAKEWAREKLRGHFSTITTPFTPEDTVDEDGLRKNIQYQLEIGTAHAIGCNWQWGEYTALSKDERKKVAEIVVDEVKKRRKGVLVGVHTTSSSVKETVELTKHAEEIGADLAVICPTFAVIRNDIEAFEFYKYVLERVDIGIVIHNNSGYPGWKMSSKCVAKIAELENAVACKIPDVSSFLEVYKLAHDKVIVSSPLNEIFFYAPYYNLEIQAKIAHHEDWMIDTPEIKPYGEFIDAAMKGDYLEMIEKFHKLCPYLEIITKWENYFASKHPQQYLQSYLCVPFGKYWGELKGMAQGHARIPFTNLTQEEKQKIKEDFLKLYGRSAREAKTLLRNL